MKYKGAYSGDVTYSVDDVVVYTDGIPYRLQNPAAAGTTCHNTMAWNRLLGPMAAAVVMFHDMFTSLLSSAADTAAMKPKVDEMLFDSKTLILASSTADSDKVYAITVDDSDGIQATEIEEETAEAAGGDS